MALQVSRIDVLEERQSELPERVARIEPKVETHSDAIAMLKAKDESLQGQLDGFMGRDRRGNR
jgi:hypothetical protein